MSGVLVRRGERHRHRGDHPLKMEDRNRDRSATATSQGKPRVAGDHPELGEELEIDSPSGSSGGTTLLTP